MIKLPQEIRSTLAGAAVVAALLVGWIGRGALNPIPADGSITAYGDWRLICPARSQVSADCQLNQDFTDTKSGVTVLRFVLSGNGKTVEVLLPHNVLLPKGIVVKLDEGDNKTFLFRTCNLAGCWVTINSDRAFYASVARAKSIIVSYIDVGGRPATRKLSDKGYFDAVSALKDAQAKRHSWIRRVLW